LIDPDGACRADVRLKSAHLAGELKREIDSMSLLMNRDGFEGLLARLARELRAETGMRAGGALVESGCLTIDFES